MSNRILNKEWLNAPGYVAAFLVILAAFQFRALFHQFQMGFLPFLHEPTRVPFSWDMFATRTERCLLEWDPPLSSTPIGALKGLRQFSKPVEWDVVYDSIQDYEFVGRIGCSFELENRPENSTSQTSGNKRGYKIQCFSPDGNETYREFNCS
jgi:hypothetical protein